MDTIKKQVRLIKKKQNNSLPGIKKITLFVLFFLWNVFSFSQNWQLINPAYKYNYYTANPAIATATIWVDSAKNNTCYLNRIIAPCDTCISAHLANDFYDTAYVLSNQPTFLQRKLMMLNNAAYNLLDKGNIIIQTKNNLNTSWLFDSINNITAQVISKTTATVLSLVDSVQCIKLSCSDTIIISKTYGILQYPTSYGSGKYYRLAGIEGLNMGLQTFKFKDFFNFSAGDVFQYDINDQNFVFTPPLFTQGIRKVTILNRLKNTDTISYQVKTTLLDSTWLGGSPAAITFSVSIDTLTFIDSANHFTNLYADQLVPITISSMFGFISTPAINQLQLGLDANNFPVKRYGVVCPNTINDISNYGLASSVDTINPYLYLIRNGILILGREAKLGLGITSDVYNNYDELKTTCLTAYIKGTDTVGTIMPDAQVTSIPVNNVPGSDILIFPNPAKDKIDISFPFLYKGKLFIYNNSGQQVFSDHVNNVSQYRLDISNFSPGIYLVKCNYNNSCITKKIIIQ